MRSKKIISAILVVCFCASFLPEGAFAASIVGKSKAAGYNHRSVDLSSRVVLEAPVFDAIPDHNDSGTVYYSGKGLFKLKIDNPEDKKFFNNGAKVRVWLAKRPESKLHLNPFNWKTLFSYSADRDVNRLSIKGPAVGEQGSFLLDIASELRKLPGMALACVAVLPAILNYKIAGGFCGLVKSKLLSDEKDASLTFKHIVEFCPKFIGFYTWASLVSPGMFQKLKNLFRPVSNLFNLFFNNSVSNTVDFKYGIVLTSKDEEAALSDAPLPKEGDLNPDSAKKQIIEQKANEKFKEELEKEGIDPKKGGFMLGRGFGMMRQQSDDLMLTKAEAKAMASKRAKDKLLTQSKLAETRPITEGFVCELDANHPEQTFRLVINDQLGSLDASLFSLALAEDVGTSFTSRRADDNISFVFEHVLPVSDQAEKLREEVKNGTFLSSISASSQEDEVLLEKVAAIMGKSKNKPGLWTKIVDLLNGISPIALSHSQESNSLPEVESIQVTRDAIPSQQHPTDDTAGGQQQTQDTGATQQQPTGDAAGGQQTQQEQGAVGQQPPQ